MSSCLKEYIITDQSIIHIQLSPMLSPQSKTYLLNSPKKNSPKQKYCFLAKTCSSTALRSLQCDRSEVQEMDQQKVSYSKLLKQKDLKILNLMEKMKMMESELCLCRNEHGALASDLKFFKSKVQEEFYRNVCMDSEIEIINTTLKAFIMKMLSLLEGSDKSMHCFAKHLESLKVDSTDSDHLYLSKKLLSTMEFQIAQLTKSFYLLKKEPEIQKSLIKSADLKFQSYKLADQLEKEALRNHISSLIDYYETRLVDSNDYNKELQNLRNQREYIKELLVSSEREKNEFANEIYEIARKEYRVDFERMNKSEVVKFCIGLLAKMKDIENDRAHLQEQLRMFSMSEKEKYENLYKLVKKLEKGEDKKLSIRRLNSMPFN